VVGTPLRELIALQQTPVAELEGATSRRGRENGREEVQGRQRGGEGGR